jgi:hypothetical protein
MKLSDKQVEEIRILLSQKIKGYKIAKMFNVSGMTISCIKHGWVHAINGQHNNHILNKLAKELSNGN